jgi:hypothetical protein
MEGLLSDLSLGIQQGFRGNVKGAAINLAKTATIIPSIASNIRYGVQGMREFLEPGRYAQLSDAVNAVTDAGFRPDRPADYRYNAVSLLGKALKQYAASEGFSKAAPAAKILYRGVGAAFQKLSAPLMEKYVPIMKTGVALHLAEDILRSNPGAPKEVISRLMNEAMDSVDNRMGEMIYDRVNLPKTIKNLGQLGFRSFGWNFGTARELGGSAFIDTPKQAASLVRGNGARVTPRMAYAMALPVGIAYLNTLLQLGLTHKMPEQPLDYFFPHDKEGNRISFKNYLTDTFQFTKHPIDTIFHKGSPIVGQAFALYQNKDYFGNQIVNPDDPLWQKSIDLAIYGAKSAAPFSITNALEMNQRGSGTAGKLMAFAGMVPAPRWVGQSKAEETAARLHVATLPAGARTKAQATNYNEKMKLLHQVQAGSAGLPELQEAVKANKISPKDANLILKMKAQNTSQLEYHVKGLSATAALTVWDQATPEERQKLLPYMGRHADSIRKSSLPLDQQEALTQAYVKRVFNASR